MKTKLTFIILILTVTVSFGEVADFDKSANSYLSNLEKSITPVLYAACKTQTGRAVLIFSLDGKQGMLFELDDRRVVNSAPLIIKRQNISIDIAETQGGIYTYTVMENHAKDLVKSPFTFVMPVNIKRIFESTSECVCVDKPPTKK